MTRTSSHLAHVIQSHGSKGASRAQTQFRNLIKKIDGQKQRLATWNETLALHHQKITLDYEPLLTSFNAQRIELVNLFDRVLEQAKLKKTEVKKLEHLILDLVRTLIVEHGCEDLKPIYDKYAETDFDTEKQADEAAASDAMKSMMEEMLGVDFGEHDDINTLDGMSRLFEEKVRQMQREEEENKLHAEERKAKRRKTARQQEKEDQKQVEDGNISKSIKEIYRKLVTAMHPDRESDPVERERKTELMQKVNVAYEKHDLLQLLELQLVLEQIDLTHITTLADERLKYYNKVLRRQSEQLQQEIDEVEERVKFQFDQPPFMPLSPKLLLDELNADIAGIKRQIVGLREDLQDFKDINYLKAWLKAYKIPPQKRPQDDFFDFL
jgi:hypothetical protein